MGREREKGTFGLRVNVCRDEYSYGLVVMRAGDSLCVAFGITLGEDK